MKQLSLVCIMSFVALSVCAKGKQQQLRACTDTGMSVMCGEASHIVRCEGYSYNYYLDNQEQGTDLTFEIITKGSKFPGPYESKKNAFTIPAPKGSISKYRYLAFQYGRDMLEGTFQMPADAENKDMIEDLSKAITAFKKSNNFKFNPKEENRVSLDTYKISAKSDLYQKCEKKNGIAPQTSEMTPEQKAVIPEGNVR